MNGAFLVASRVDVTIFRAFRREFATLVPLPHGRGSDWCGASGRELRTLDVGGRVLDFRILTIHQPAATRRVRIR